jgi:hypothetical protein
MHKLMVAASAAALLAVSSVGAFAEEATGTISSIDVAAGTLTLATGETFALPASVDAASLQIGTDVTIEYEEGEGGAMTATSVEPSAM